MALDGVGRVGKCRVGFLVWRCHSYHVVCEVPSELVAGTVVIGIGVCTRAGDSVSIHLIHKCGIDRRQHLAALRDDLRHLVVGSRHCSREALYSIRAVGQRRVGHLVRYGRRIYNISVSPVDVVARAVFVVVGIYHRVATAVVGNTSNRSCGNDLVAAGIQHHGIGRQVGVCDTLYRVYAIVGECESCRVENIGISPGVVATIYHIMVRIYVLVAAFGNIVVRSDVWSIERYGLAADGAVGSVRSDYGTVTLHCLLYIGQTVEFACFDNMDSLPEILTTGAVGITPVVGHVAVTVDIHIGVGGSHRHHIAVTVERHRCYQIAAGVIHVA